MTRSKPWYQNFEAECKKANRRIKTGLRVKKENQDAFQNELHNYWLESVIKTIFESNRLEDAGLSEGETKKLILEDQELLKNFEELLSPYHHEDALRKWYESQQKSSIVKFKKWERTSREVTLHASTLLMGFLSATGFQMKKENPNHPWSIIFFSENGIKTMHSVLMNDLIPKEWGLRSGVFRNAPCHTNHETLYIDWRNLPRAMKEWSERSNALMLSDKEPVTKAAKISYEFVAIHPFPDGNGRLSRIIMNMALMADGLPFLAVLRGDKKEKHRYLTALRHANRGNLNSYACLIARAVNAGFDEFNRRLELAGLEPVTIND